MESPVQKIINDAKADLSVCDEEVTQAITHLNGEVEFERVEFERVDFGRVEFERQYI